MTSTLVHTAAVTIQRQTRCSRRDALRIAEKALEVVCHASEHLDAVAIAEGRNGKSQAEARFFVKLKTDLRRIRTAAMKELLP